MILRLQKGNYALANPNHHTFKTYMTLLIDCIELFFTVFQVSDKLRKTLQTDGAMKVKSKKMLRTCIPPEVVTLCHSLLFSVFFFLLVLQCLRSECLWRVS